MERGQQALNTPRPIRLNKLLVHSRAFVSDGMVHALSPRPQSTRQRLCVHSVHTAVPLFHMPLERMAPVHKEPSPASAGAPGRLEFV
jgi:hypothetical protein